MNVHGIHIATLSLISIAASSCVDEIDVSVFNDSGTLVVDGMISDQPGPYQITLRRSEDFFELQERDPRFINENGAVQNAQVLVEDEKGNSEVFLEIAAGIYQSSPTGIVGCVGSSYKLSIILENGESYESSFETISPNSGIRETVKEEVTKAVLDDNNIERFVEGIGMTIVPNGFEQPNEFYRWRWEGTYQVKAFPELRQKAIKRLSSQTQDPPMPPFEFSPDPVPCSGYIAVGSGLEHGMPILDLVLFSVSPCECCDCWVTESVDVSVISTTSVGAAAVHFDFYEDTNPRFGQKYYLKLQQLSLSKEAHQFWSIIEQQQNNNSLFSSSGREIPTNIKSLDDENKRVLGYFTTTSIDEVAFYLNDDNLQKAPIVLDTIKNDCRKLKNSTDKTPIFW